MLPWLKMAWSKNGKKRDFHCRIWIWQQKKMVLQKRFQFSSCHDAETSFQSVAHNAMHQLNNSKLLTSMITYTLATQASHQPISIINDPSSDYHLGQHLTNQFSNKTIHNQVQDRFYKDTITHSRFSNYAKFLKHCPRHMKEHSKEAILPTQMSRIIARSRIHQTQQLYI